MIKHYIIIAWRNLKRRKLLSLIQILCLSIGLAAFMLIARFIQYEKDWDRFNEHYSLIYRAQAYKIDDRLNDNTQIPVPVAEYLKINYPEVNQSLVIREIWSENLSPDNEKVYNEKNGFLAPSQLFDVFSFKLLRGDRKTVLDIPSSIVLSESMAEKYFSGVDPIGKVIFDSNKNELVVTGVMADIPEQSHIQADYFKSNAQLLEDYGSNWYNNSYKTYVLLEPGVSVQSFNAKIKDVINIHDISAKRTLYLRPLSQLHLNENPRDDRSVIIYFFSFIGLLILILACVSFMNLATSFSSLRFIEIGIRKVVGSSKNYLRIQFLVEAVVVAFISFLVAVFIAHLILPLFNSVVDRNIELHIFTDWPFLAFILMAVVLTGILAGVYPAFIISSFKPVVVLKGKSPFKKGRITGLQAMVYVQFVLSITLITASLWIYKQVEFLETKDIGFDNKVLLNGHVPSNNSTVSYAAFRKEILSHPGVSEMAISLNSPMILNWGCYVIPEGEDKETPIFTRWNSACHHFINAMSMDIVEGRSFSEDLATDIGSCLINETAARAYGWDNPIGKTLQMEGEYRVIGVIKDFNIDDVHNPIIPYVLFLRDSDLAIENDFNFKIDMPQRQAAKEHIILIMQKYFPDVLFIVDDYKANSNRIELKIWNNAKNSFAFFTILAVIIASLGLFGLVFFSMQRRIKEIGVRKVQGASMQQIIPLITKRYLVIALVANIIIYPVAKLIQNILPGHYKYQFTLIDVLIVCGITILVTLLSSLYQAIKAAHLNPIKALRYE
ncbi:ABC transporter permease [Carboxylicivirga sp. N1Y90]|uniref:ABC transporter permease n=1 Tax=Carboxylicivirga fragile TaxID=3417571 RepID=UPI003D3354CC|nr:ABC transporter permease [Marinilabiliaceae bacterium N1Y90]